MQLVQITVAMWKMLVSDVNVSVRCFFIWTVVVIFYALEGNIFSNNLIVASLSECPTWVSWTGDFDFPSYEVVYVYLLSTEM